MKLIVEIKTKDDKWQKHVCNDFPAMAGDFVTLYKEGFKRDLLSISQIAEIKQSFKK